MDNWQVDEVEKTATWMGWGLRWEARRGQKAGEWALGASQPTGGRGSVVESWNGGWLVGLVFLAVMVVAGGLWGRQTGVPDPPKPPNFWCATTHRHRLTGAALPPSPF